MKFVTFRKNSKYVKWYGGIVHNLGTMAQILAGLPMFNLVQFRAIFSLANTKCLGGLIFFRTHSIYMRAVLWQQ